MNVYCAVRSYCIRIFVASSIVSTSLPAAADVGRPVTGGRHPQSLTGLIAKSKPRFAAVRPAQANSGYVIRDLGAPLVACAGAGPSSRAVLSYCRGGATPAVFFASPNAIDQAGDVALAYCFAADCNAYPPVNTYAYLYDYQQNALIPLATFSQTPTRRIPMIAPPIVQYTPYALNDRGQIVGGVTILRGNTSTTRPVIWTRHGSAGSAIAFLDPSPNDQGIALGINNAGTVVGTSSNYPTAWSGAAVEFTGGTTKLLDAKNHMPQEYAAAFAINDAGVATGGIDGVASTFAGGYGQAIAFQQQCEPPLGFCDETNTGVAINRNGEVVGNFNSYFFDMASWAITAFSWSNNNFQPLYPTCFDTDCPIEFSDYDADAVTGLNNGGDFVGWFEGVPWTSLAFYGDVNTLLPPNSTWKIVTATGVNDRQQIVGQGYPSALRTQTHAYLLDPIR